MSAAPENGAGTPPAGFLGKGTPAWRLLVALGSVGALSGLFLAVTWLLSVPRIKAYEKQQIQMAVAEVLKEPAQVQTLYVSHGALAPTPPPGVEPDAAEKVYRGLGADGQPSGYAILAEGPGFQETIKLIYGYDPATKTILGMKVIEHKETPSLGDKIEKDPHFQPQFGGAVAPLVGVKPGSANTAGQHKIDTITGATISSRAVISIINKSVARWDPLLAGARGEATR